jgi:hypothetical protein
MAERTIEVPQLRAGNWRAVSLETCELAGNRLAAVTVRDLVQPTIRRWFGEERDALAYAAQESDARSLPLIDLRDPESGA